MSQAEASAPSLGSAIPKKASPATAPTAQVVPPGAWRSRVRVEEI